MATYFLTKCFDYFFGKFNASPTMRSIASSQYNTVKCIISKIEAVPLASSTLPASCRARMTAPPLSTQSMTWISLRFPVICHSQEAAGRVPTHGIEIVSSQRSQLPFGGDHQYVGKVHYASQSMCVKMDLGIKVEILPAVMKSGNTDPAIEPFILYRPETGIWEDGYARLHQGYLSVKNDTSNTGGNFIPMIKVFKAPSLPQWSRRRVVSY